MQDECQRDAAHQVEKEKKKLDSCTKQTRDLESSLHACTAQNRQREISTTEMEDQQLVMEGGQKILEAGSGEEGQKTTQVDSGRNRRGEFSTSGMEEHQLDIAKVQKTTELGSWDQTFIYPTQIFSGQE